MNKQENRKFLRDNLIIKFVDKENKIWIPHAYLCGIEIGDFPSGSTIDPNNKDELERLKDSIIASYFFISEKKKSGMDFSEYKFFTENLPNKFVKKIDIILRNKKIDNILL